MNRRDEQLDLNATPEVAALDAELRRLMPVAAPGDLVRRIELAAGVYDPSLDAELRRELGVDVPAELVEQVVAACGLADVPLDRALRTTLAAGDAPAGLIERIEAATADIAGRVARHADEPAVIVVGRIGLAAAWRGAAAAAVLMAATAALVVSGIGPGVPTTPNTPTIARNANQPTLDEQVAMMNLSLDASAEADTLGARIDEVAGEIDAVAVAMMIGAVEDSFGTDAGLLDDELDLLEARIKSF